MAMTLSTVEQTLLLAAYLRGMPPERYGWISCCDQVVVLSLFYTGDISFEECATGCSGDVPVPPPNDPRGLSFA